MVDREPFVRCRTLGDNVDNSYRSLQELVSLNAGFAQSMHGTQDMQPPRMRPEEPQKRH